MWEDLGAADRLVGRKQSNHERRNIVEDQERVKPEGEEEVEAHAVRPDAAEDKVAATEEPPDVEAHRLPPKAKP
jgi:hypothetical protein